MANNHDIVYMAPPPDGRPRFDGSPTRQFAMGLVSIVTTVIAFAVVALRVITRKYVVKMPLRVDDCEFRSNNYQRYLAKSFPRFRSGCSSRINSLGN